MALKQWLPLILCPLRSRISRNGKAVQMDRQKPFQHAEKIRRSGYHPGHPEPRADVVVPEILYTIPAWLVTESAQIAGFTGDRVYFCVSLRSGANEAGEFSDGLCYLQRSQAAGIPRGAKPRSNSTTQSSLCNAWRS